MTTPTNYIATWFYKESKEDASFYPQAGKRGDSALVHSILDVSYGFQGERKRYFYVNGLMRQ